MKPACHQRAVGAGTAGGCIVTAATFLAALPLMLPLAACAGETAGAPPRRPNIVLVYTDDQAAWTLGVSGHPQAHTPNLDRLAREGARLTNAFVTTPVCSPSRGGLMTSRYSSELRIHDFIPPREHPEFKPAADTGLDPAGVTFPEVLRQAGYETALFGKWHLGDWRDDPQKRYHPTGHGFAHFLGFVGGAGPANPVTAERDGTTRAWQGLTDDILTSEAIAFARPVHSRLLPAAGTPRSSSRSRLAPTPPSSGAPAATQAWCWWKCSSCRRRD